MRQVRQPGTVGEASASEAVRALLARKALADARHRAALARLLDLTDSDVLAIQHLAREGALMPSRLSRLLGLTSGGTTALLQRLDRLGYLERVPNPADRRSALVRLSERAGADAGELYAPLVRELDAAVAALEPQELAAVRAFLGQVAAIGERHADALARRAEDERPAAAAVPVPGLWA